MAACKKGPPTRARCGSEGHALPELEGEVGRKLTDDSVDAVKLLEDHEDAGNDELRAVLPLHDVEVGRLDQVGLPSSLHNVLKLSVHLRNAAAPFQDLHICT